MRIKLDDLATFQDICRKICLNMPNGCVWKWDPNRQMAVMVLADEDAEMVFYPLFKEFSHHWNFSSPAPSPASVTEYINSKFGVLPGQVFFTSNPLFNIVLFVAWWPWGNQGNVSMRVGLIPWNNTRLQEGFAFQCLRRWLNIVDSIDSDVYPSSEASAGR